VKKRIPFLIISLIILLLLAFSEWEDAAQDPIFLENFSRTLSERALKRDYPVWENGAILNIFLEKEIFNSGGKSLGIEIVSPNPNNESNIGSFYRALDLFQGNWHGAVGIRFWINNPHGSPLMISFNLKERYREYWAVAENGVFYLQDEAGIINQKEIYYSNLIIPKQFQGTVILPFDSLVVPEWNTAKTNHILDLNSIESFAISVIVDNQTPRTFLIDEIEVFGKTTFKTLSVQGTETIKVPDSGEHLETYTAKLGALDSTTLSNNIDVTWSIQALNNPLISINRDGVLRIPAGSKDGIVSVDASFRTPDYILTNSIEVNLIGGEVSEVDASQMEETLPEIEHVFVDQDTLSARFDTWTSENRALFVFLTIIGLLIFFVFLTLLQSKIK
jgi:hypothetical protein